MPPGVPGVPGSPMPPGFGLAPPAMGNQKPKVSMKSLNWTKLNGNVIKGTIFII
jgi:hypothetical protein